MTKRMFAALLVLASAVLLGAVPAQAADLVISENLRSQVSGLKVAVRNPQ